MDIITETLQKSCARIVKLVHNLISTIRADTITEYYINRNAYITCDYHSWTLIRKLLYIPDIDTCLDMQYWNMQYLKWSPNLATDT